MIILRQKEFNSKAQKARRAKFDNAQIPLGYNREEHQNLIKKLHKSGKHDLDSAMAASDKHFKRNRVKDYIGGVEANKSDLNTRKANYLSKKLLGKDYNTFGSIALGAKPETDLFKKEAAEDKAKFSKVNSKLNSDNIAKKATETISKDKTIKSPKVNPKLVKNLKTAGKVGLGVAGAAGIGYGIKKAIDKNKKKKEDK